MAINEPATLLTDYLLAVIYAALGLRLLRQASEVSVRLLGASFLAAGATAFVGGTHHGFGGEAWWRATLYTVGLASFLLVAGSVYAAVAGASQRLLVAAAALKLAAYWIWVTSHHEFRWVIYDYGSAMALVLAFALWAQRGARWVAAAVIVTVAGSAVQQSGFALHRHFNHNDLYHVFQMAAAWLFYRGFRQYRDAA